MYRFEYKAYRRSFSVSFSNARETYARRSGLLLRLEDRDGRVGFGEAAPIESFGTESFLSALSVAESIGNTLDWDRLAEEVKAYPALNWGIESALHSIVGEGEAIALDEPWPVCGLVMDLADQVSIRDRMARHYPCLKFKIGKEAFERERRLLDAVVDMTDGKTRLRLDANATLSLKDAIQWLESLQDVPVEFVEQPMAKGSEGEMLRLCGDFPIPIALDESVCSVDDLKRMRDLQWPGVFVVKPSLCGSLRELRHELRGSECDVVYSSALETAIGSTSALRVALEFPGSRRALGWGVEDLFADSGVGLQLGPYLGIESLPGEGFFEGLWKRM